MLYTSGIQYMREVDELTSVALREVAASREMALLYALEGYEPGGVPPHHPLPVRWSLVIQEVVELDDFRHVLDVAPHHPPGRRSLPALKQTPRL